VLVAEDNRINQKVILGMLQKYHGISADCCDNGEQAVARLREGEPYDLVLMDCEMPVMDGYEATRHIRALPPPRNAVAIAALTAHAVPELREKAFAAGVDHYLTKPLSRGAVDALIRTVSEALPPADRALPS
ncbi:MAG: response regulator, partial [Moraxellaceae bacterium]